MRPPAYDIQGRDALFDPERMTEWRWHQNDDIADPNPFGVLGNSRKKYLGCGGSRQILKKMMLDDPDIVESHFIGEPDLFQRFPKCRGLSPSALFRVYWKGDAIE